MQARPHSRSSCPHSLRASTSLRSKTWMAGTSPAMTRRVHGVRLTMLPMDRLFIDRHGLRHCYACVRDDAAIGNSLDTRATRRIEGAAVGAIDVACELES